MNTKVIDVLGTGASLGGVALSHKVLGSAWKRITGNPPPAKNPDPSEAWGAIIVWALVTGLVGTVIKVGVHRQMAKMQNKPKSKSASEV
jgi:hypothetical protein